MTRFAGLSLACQRGEWLVFAGLDFVVESGGALILTGPNGSGKSSLLRLMAGLIKPFAGGLEWNGKPVRQDPDGHRGMTAYLGHLDALKPALTVGEAIRFWAGLGGGDAAPAEAALIAMGLARLVGQPARFLSAGQRRRAALARVIASGRPLWLLDEPTVGLDSRSIAALEGQLDVHRRDGGMVIAATHAPIALPGAARIDLAEFDASQFLTGADGQVDEAGAG